MITPSFRREFIVRIGSLSALLATGAALSACGGSSDPSATPVVFNYGVASGDPLADRVILWTHAKPETGSEAVELTYEVSSTVDFAALVTSGKAMVTEASGYTAKADAKGLAAGKEYFYRFKSAGGTSAAGRTRTLPAAPAAEVKLAVMSCANYPAGFFNVYAEASKSDAQFFVHLGDYIYEYDAKGYASETAAALGRTSDPLNETLTLSDYRKRHAQYKSDADLKVLHGRMPLIAVWDDHEVSNDTYKDGAENHTEATEVSQIKGIFEGVVDDLKWMDPSRRGYLKMTFTATQAKGEWVFIDKIDTRSYSVLPAVAAESRVYSI